MHVVAWARHRRVREKTMTVTHHAKVRRAAALDQITLRDPAGSRLPDGAAAGAGTAFFDHPVPHVPLVLDGEVLDDPGRVEDMHTVRLYYTPLHHGPGVALGAFTERKAMLAASRRSQEVLASLSLTTARTVCTSDPDSLGEFAGFFEHMHFGGDGIWLGPARGFPDLTQGDWNDVISSVDWCRWDVELFEHVQFSGDTLYLWAGCDTPYLEAFGWNDRASSAINWGFRR
jgi:hypothetical protein